MGTGGNGAAAEAGGTNLSEDLDGERYSKLNQIYLLIISKYKEYIEEKEELSVAELPTLVMPKAKAVSRKAEEIRNAFRNYSYEINFKDAASKAFQFVSLEIDDINLPLQFWLTPEETMRFMGGDITDKNILLCSMLIALGNPSSKVLVVINGSERKIAVYYEFGGGIVAFDTVGGSMNSFETRDALLESLSIGEDTTAYEFNDQMYIDIG